MPCEVRIWVAMDGWYVLVVTVSEQTHQLPLALNDVATSEGYPYC